MNFVDEVMDRNYDVIIFILRKPREAIFAKIVKIVTMFTKTSLKTQKMLKECIEIQSISVFLDISKFANFQ